MCPASIGCGHKGLMAVVCLSVCLSVLCLTLSREWNGVAGCKLAGMKTWHEWPVTPYRGRKVEDHGPKPINAETENATYLPKGRSTNFKLGTQGWSMMTRITDMHGDVKGQGEGNEVTSSVWCVFAHNSTTKCRNNSKIIGRKVVRTTADIPHQFQGRKIKSQRHHTAVGGCSSHHLQGRGILWRPPSLF